MAHPDRSFYEVFEQETDKSPGGVLAEMWRMLVKRMGVAKKLKSLCKRAQNRDNLQRMYKSGIELDNKLEHRLYQQAVGTSLTINSLTKLMRHLLSITEFKIIFEIRRVDKPDELIRIERAVIGSDGPVPSEDDLQMVLNNIRALHEAQMSKDNTNEPVQKTEDQDNEQETKESGN